MSGVSKLVDDKTVEIARKNLARILHKFSLFDVFAVNLSKALNF